MYFSIPDTTEISAKRSIDQRAYILFNIHINGIHYCSLRYSQLRRFNDEVQRSFSNSLINSQPFPPKKFFRLSLREIDERRILLERYLQSVVPNKSLTSSIYFNEFFLNAQHETFVNEFIERTCPETINLTVYLLNKHEMILENFSPYDNLSKLFHACTNKIQLDDEYYSYFSLFLYEYENNQLNLIRPLFSFEYPYISFEQTKLIHKYSCLVFKKSYWDLNYDLRLLDNRYTRNLVFIQAEYDIEQSKHIYPSDIYEQLDVLHDNEYITLARTSKFYGYLIFQQCSMNDLITQKLSQCILTIGNNEMICYFINDDKENEDLFVKNISFKVTRIRCWKVNWTKLDLNITFEYLIKKDSLQWFTIHTEQAALISTCLQSIVDEILAKNDETTSPVTVVDISNNGNALATRTRSDFERLSNNEIFDRDNGDDDL
ncbi:unnamed protein product [Adineta steineri]|uniref:PX domain-containing protein n=2 Tax=Adineta steineri TaxID=433720 RepID=A0A815MHE6_9BILA|nr:unnamed protein product [Adineta steineri]CAF3942880.1 unnamed protein product [Adineta steineri]